MKGCQLSFEERLVPKLKPNATREEKLAWMAQVAWMEELPKDNAERVTAVTVLRSEAGIAQQKHEVQPIS